MIVCSHYGSCQHNLLPSKDPWSGVGPGVIKAPVVALVTHKTTMGTEIEKAQVFSKPSANLVKLLLLSSRTTLGKVDQASVRHLRLTVPEQQASCINSKLKVEKLRQCLIITQWPLNAAVLQLQNNVGHSNVQPRYQIIVVHKLPMVDGKLLSTTHSSSTDTWISRCCAFQRVGTFLPQALQTLSNYHHLYMHESAGG
jgi:hypothetical protein